MMTIGVTGASGHLGTTVLKILANERPSGVRLTALTRTPAMFPKSIPCDEIRIGDFNEPEALTASLEGIDVLLLISVEGPDDERVKLHQNAISAAAKAKVGRIVYTSFFDVDPNSPSSVARVHRLTEEAIERSGISWTFLRDGPYVDNIARRIADAAYDNGVFRMAVGAARMPFISRADIAKAAARALIRNQQGNVAFRLSGRELLDYESLCRLISMEIDRPVRYADLSDEDHLQELIRTGTPEEYLSRRIAYAQAIRQGFMTALTDDYMALTGEEPRRIDEVLGELNLRRSDDLQPKARNENLAPISTAGLER